MACPEDFEEDVTIETVAYASDGAGGQSEAWTARKVIFCMVEETSGGEAYIAGRNEHTSSFVLTAHYDAEILPTDRVDLGGVKYKITRVENIDRKEEYMRIYIESGRT